MSLPKTIFVRITLLVFILIIAIGATGWFLEIQHRKRDTLDRMQVRTQVLADVAESFGLQKKSVLLREILNRPGSFHPAVRMAFIEQEGAVLVSSSDNDVPQHYLAWATTGDGGVESREFENSQGVVFIDMAAEVKGRTNINGSTFVHLILAENLLASESSKMLQYIIGMSVLAFIMSIPAVWVITRLTTLEVSRLTNRLQQYGDDLENLVAQRTESLRWYEGIVASTNDQMSYLDSDYIYRAVNSAYLTTHGKIREEIVGKSVGYLFGDDVFQKVIKEKIDRCLAGETIEYREWFDFAGTGRRCVDVVYSPIKVEDGSINGVVVSARDVTLLHQAQEELEKTEARYSSLFEGMSNGVAVYAAVDDGEDFVFVDYNPAGQLMDKTTKEEAVGKRVTDVFPAVKEFGLLDVLQRVYKTGISEVLPVTGYSDNKVAFWRQNTVYKLPSGELVAIYSDETSRMKAEEILRTEHARFVAVLESLDAVVYAADMDTHEVLFANKPVRDLFGDVVGKKCWESIQLGQSGPCVFCTNDRLLGSTGKPREPYIWEFQNTSNGNWYQCHDQAIQWPDGRMVRLEIATDITGRKMRENEIQLRGKKLEGLSDVAHVLLGASGDVPFQAFAEAVGPCSNASQAYVFINSLSVDGSLLMSQKAQWRDKSFQPEMEKSQFQDLPYAEWMSQWKDLLLKGEVINKCQGDFPAKERSMLEPLGIKSILLVPIMVGDDLVGFSGLNNCVSETEWNEADVAFLRAATSDLSQTIRRLRSESKVREALNEKDVLLREIHHRVKNNMQVITSLLSLQSRKISDEQALNAIRESQDRIHVMSLVHETLYRSSDLSSIAMDDYFTNLITDIAHVHHGASQRVNWQVDAGSVTLAINEAIPIGLIANELISNAFKHAFPLGKRGNIRLVLKEAGKGEMQLIISDDGQGIPDGVDVYGSKTLGLQLVNRLAEGQLGGTLDIQSENGTRVQVTFFNGFRKTKLPLLSKFPA